MGIDTKFSGSIPEMYERYFVPLQFEAYARDIAQRVAALEPVDVLETACGTGIVTRALAARLPASVRIVATDLNPPMVERAATLLPGDARITWQNADALELPFGERTFDAVVCQFGAMFFPDKLRGYAEALRVLRPGGSFVFNVWDRIEENVFADVVTAALALVFPADPPRFMARIPHGYYDLTKICEELATAGFESVTVETRTETSRAPSARDVAIGYCEGTPLRSEIEARDASRLAEATDRVTVELERRFGKGPVEGRMQAHVVTAVA